MIRNVTRHSNRLLYHIMLVYSVRPTSVLCFNKHIVLEYVPDLMEGFYFDSILLDVCYTVLMLYIFFSIIICWCDPVTGVSFDYCTCAFCDLRASVKLNLLLRSETDFICAAEYMIKMHINV